MIKICQHRGWVFLGLALSFLGQTMDATPGNGVPVTFTATSGAQASSVTVMFYGWGDDRFPFLPTLQAETVQADLTKLRLPGFAPDYQTLWDRFPTFLPTDPPRYYSKNTTVADYQSDFNGHGVLTTIDRTGSRRTETYTGQPGGDLIEVFGSEVRTDLTLTRAYVTFGPIPYTYASWQGTATITQTLSDEYTDAMLAADTRALLPPFTGSLGGTTSVGVNASFSPDHTYYSISQARYNVVWPTGASATAPKNLIWISTSAPPLGQSGSPTTTLQGWTGTALSTPVQTLAPSGEGSTQVTIATVALAVDANHDGRVRFPGQDSSDQTAADQPYLYRLNDNFDAGATTPDYADDVVNGKDDLKDFFPVGLYLTQLLNALPAGVPVTVKLKQADGALNFVYTNLRLNATGVDLAPTTTGFGPAFTQPAASATTQQITAAGVPLSATFLDAIKNQGQGVILVEGRIPTAAPLIMEVSGPNGVLVEIPVHLRGVHFGLVVDRDRNGTIALDASDTTNTTKPYRFWINDDTDAGDTVGNDIPLGTGVHSGRNCDDSQINGRRDLIDFFPVLLDIKSLLISYPPASIVGGTSGATYRLKHADGAVNIVWTRLTRAQAVSFQTQDMGSLFGNVGSNPVQLNVPIENARATRLTASGIDLFAQCPDFYAAISSGDGGVLLLEGNAPTTAPLVLSIEKDGAVLAQVELALSIGRVEEMFRHLNLSYVAGDTNTVPTRLAEPSNLPDMELNGKNFVFLHGYNVDQEGARGWSSEIFKKMWWSGSHAKFYGITWRGSDTKIKALSLTPNLQINIVHAFQTAPSLAAFLNQLTGETTTAAHSLGNMLLLASLNPPLNSAGQRKFTAASITRHFAFDAALAAEAVDGITPARSEMSNSLWEDYTGSIDHTLWASEWYRLFPNDYRSNLTWRDRLSSANGATIYNFYSDGSSRANASGLNFGEEVLNYRDDYTNRIPTAINFPISQLRALLAPTGEGSWYYQETLKGLAGTIYENFWNQSLNALLTGFNQNTSALSSKYGGWGFGLDYETEDDSQHIPPSRAAVAAISWSDVRKREQPLFLYGSTWQISSSPGEPTERVSNLYSTTGAAFAERHLASLLAEMIPARSVAMGREAISLLGPINSKNFDLSSSVFQDDWPQSRKDNATQRIRWLHSDAHDVAYRFNHGLFDIWIGLGNLNTSP